MDDVNIWSGWKFTPVGEKPEGGYGYQYYLYRRKRYNAQVGVIEILRKLAPSLVTGTPDSSIDDAKIQAILSAIEQKQPGYGLKHIRNFFVQGLDRGVRAGLWKVHVPSPIMTVPRPKALFQPETFAALPKLRRIQAALEQSWSDPHFFVNAEPYLTPLQNQKGFRPGNETQQLRAGQLLLTAIVYGGLLDTEYLYLLPMHIDQLQAYPHGCWIDFIQSQTLHWEDKLPRQPADKGKRLYTDSVFQRRWFPDSLTELLLLRWRVDHLGGMPVHKGLTPDKGERYCQWLIDAFLASVGLADHRIPLRELMSAAITHNALILPTFLLNTATGKLATTSLPTQAWQRLVSDCRGNDVVMDQEPVSGTCGLPVHEPMICDERVIEQSDQYQLFKKLSKRLTLKRIDPRRPHAKSIEIIEGFLAEHDSQLAPALRRLGQWAIELYRNGSANQRRLAASTVAIYFGQLQDLVHVLGAEDPLGLEGDELLEIYQDLINRSKTPKNIAFRAGRVKEFHLYLQKCGYAEPLNLAELEGVQRLGARVDANYINETAYQVTLESLKHLGAVDPRCVASRRLITILGYRCGLRRTEAWKLRLCDIQLGHYPVLFVRASRQKTVKSSHATRQLPLTALLTPAELAELVQWLEHRRLEEAHEGFKTDDSFVFSYGHHGLSLINESVVFPVIQTVLRAVTGDNTVRYHHLRHSFANNCLLRLQSVDWPDLAICQPVPAESEAGVIFGLNHCQPSRKHLYQVSALLGHASPDITLKSYIHLCDYLLREHLNQAHDSAISIETITAISGIGRDALYKRKQRSEVNLSVLQVAKQQLRNRLMVNNDTNRQVKQDAPIEWPVSLQQGSIPQPFQDEPSIAELHQLIENYDPKHRNARYWSEKTGYAENAIQAWMDTALQLSQMKTGKSVPRHIRPTWWGLSNNAGQKTTTQIQVQQSPPRCMPKPHSGQDRRDSEQVLHMLKKLRINDPELADWGMDYYIKTNVASHSHVHMKSAEIAQRYRAFIKALGFSSKRIQVQLKPQQRPESASAEEQIQHWAAMLSITSQQIRLNSALRIRGGEWGSLRMTVINNKGEASYGFKYALYMTAILMFAIRESCDEALPVVS